MTDASMTTAQTSGSNTLSAFFDERSDAVDAMDRLRALGIPDSSLRMTEGSERDRDAAQPVAAKGFFESLGDLFFPDEDRSAYAEGLARGGYLVTVSGLSTAMYDQALDILDDEGAVDIDERQESWRAEGWSGSTSGMTAGAAAGSAAGIYAGTGTTPDADTALRRADAGMTGSDLDPSDYRRSGTDPVTGSSLADDIGDAASRATSAIGSAASSVADAVTGTEHSGTYGASGRDDTDDTNETLKIAREELRVGKRDRNMGRVRVRSYIVEEPASADVQLRRERVEIERHAVDRAVTGSEDPFRERSIEAEEFDEEAVVGKEVRVVEEIGLRRESETRTETVSDTVRRTEVEIDDERDGETTSRTRSGDRI